MTAIRQGSAEHEQARRVAKEMFHYIRGKITTSFEGGVVIESGGIGYEVFVPDHSAAYQRQGQEETLLYTAMIVREDDISLYGFTDRDGITLFKRLLTVNGVGAKAAVAILSALSPGDIRKAILFEDAKALTKAQGIGSKTAQRIILELKDKIGSTGGLDLSSSQEAAENIAASDARTEAVFALMALGYSRAEAAEAVGRVKEETAGAKEYIKLALKSLS